MFTNFWITRGYFNNIQRDPAAELFTPVIHCNQQKNVCFPGIEIPRQSQ